MSKPGFMNVEPILCNLCLRHPTYHLHYAHHFQVHYKDYMTRRNSTESTSIPAYGPNLPIYVFT